MTTHHVSSIRDDEERNEIAKFLGNETFDDKGFLRPPSWFSPATP